MKLYEYQVVLVKGPREKRWRKGQVLFLVEEAGKVVRAFVGLSNGGYGIYDVEFIRPES